MSFQLPVLGFIIIFFFIIGFYFRNAINLNFDWVKQKKKSY